MLIKINKNPYDYNIFKKNTLELKENSINCLVGCNGSGKTTLIKEIISYIKPKAKEIKGDFYDNAFSKIFLNENNTKPELYYLDFDKNSNVALEEMDYFFNAANLAYSSTGEGIMERFGKNLQLLGSTIRHLQDTKLMIFFDDCDAGTSVDMINDIKEVFKYIIDDCKKRNIIYYILLTSNSYEMVRDINCIDVYNFNELHFKNYEWS